MIILCVKGVTLTPFGMIPGAIHLVEDELGVGQALRIAPVLDARQPTGSGVSNDIIVPSCLRAIV
jgi:hypothetical protein